MAQLKSTNILGNLAVTGNVVASSIKIPGGLASQALMANGETKTLGTAAYRSEESFLAANALNGYLSTSNTPVDNEIVSFNGTTGKVQTSGATINDSGDITAKRYLVGTWLQTTANNALGSAATKICVQDSGGWLYTRTPSQICSDINALPLTAGYDKQLTGILYANKPVGIKGTFDNNTVPTDVQGVVYLAYNSSYDALEFIFS